MPGAWPPVVTLHQALCFPVYRIAWVANNDYIVLDRYQLGYLNFYERLRCEYCANASGLLAHAAEIIARKEQYFCPIKHARKVLDTHAHNARFPDYGEGSDYHERLERFRQALAENDRGGPP